MKKAFLLFVIFINLLICAVCEAKTLQFAQISDMHLSLIPENEIKEGELTKGDYLLKAIKEINENKEIKFVIFSGDSIGKPDKKTMSKFLKIADKLNKPYYLVIGENEVLRRKNFDKKDFMRMYKLHNLSLITKGTNYVIKPNKELVFIFVDGTNETMPTTSGYFKSQTLNWLDKKLSQYKDKKVVLVQHYPIIEPSGKFTHKTVEPEKYFHTINAHDNVIAIVSGHFHSNNTIYKKGIYHLSAPAFKDENREYKIIKIEYNPKYLFANPSEFEITQEIKAMKKQEVEIQEEVEYDIINDVEYNQSEFIEEPIEENNFLEEVE